MAVSPEIGACANTAPETTPLNLGCTQLTRAFSLNVLFSFWLSVCTPTVPDSKVDWFKREPTGAYARNRAQCRRAQRWL